MAIRRCRGSGQWYGCMVVEGDGYSRNGDAGVDGGS